MPRVTTLLLLSHSSTQPAVQGVHPPQCLPLSSSAAPKHSRVPWVGAAEQPKGVHPKTTRQQAPCTVLSLKDLTSSTHFLLARGTLHASLAHAPSEMNLSTGPRVILTKVAGSSVVTTIPSMAQSRTPIRGSRGPREATPCTTGRPSMRLLTASL